MDLCWYRCRFNHRSLGLEKECVVLGSNLDWGLASASFCGVRSLDKQVYVIREFPAVRSS